MSQFLQKELDKLKISISKLAAIVEENLKYAVLAVTKHDKKIAETTIAKDEIIDAMEIEMEQDCLKILALYHPVAPDLRYVITCLRVNNDLERIGDLSARIAACAITISDMKCNKEFEYKHFDDMTKITQNMIKKSLDALFAVDIKLAFEVFKEADRVDSLNDKMHVDVAEILQKKYKKSQYFLTLLTVSKDLKRIADHATNIAEDIIYMVDGRIIRHSNRIK